MQQNENKMQAVKQLSEIRWIPICSDKETIRRLRTEIIDKYLGVPYKNQGRDLNGLDCYGLIINVYRDLGCELFDIDCNYNRNWSIKGENYIIDNYHKNWEKVKNHQFLDVVLFVNSKNTVNHAGIILDEERFIHSCRAGTIITRLKEKSFHKRIQGFYRIKVKK